MSDTRHRNCHWILPTDADGRVERWEYVSIAVLMDIRDELQTLNRLLGCPNFTNIPTVLRSIRRNTAKPRKPRKRKGGRRA